MADPAHIRLPPAEAERARAFLAERRPVVPPRAAATVVLLRDVSGPDQGVEVYLLRRHRGMAFAAGMFAFPGGAVDPRDSDHVVGWAGPSPAHWADRLQCPEPEARALVCAAIRETFEESGVLLAGPGRSELVADTTGPDWEDDRVALIERRLPFADFLTRRRLVARSDLLHLWAHWITPEYEPRRYDTRFFVARVPPGQRTRDVGGEADHVVWMPPSHVLAAADDGAMRMLPPTYVTIAEIDHFPDVDQVLLASMGRPIVTIMPRLEDVDGTLVLSGPASPWAAGTP